ncbi:carboxymuconolactone decarboxylase family protein [Azospirillum halopraeferens]|uniref:carboxymuconolactone decarboxylase family protein n=1 Tax=Azospirillum halopraeferens TaxID=34010 RepID=UPI000405A2DC|nr:carboxymuconolactone decarboxylase family protein [Azospirillum halopraeferens]
MTVRIDVQADAPGLYAALLTVSTAVMKAGLPERLRHLIDLRVSQINGCAYCIGLHTDWALGAGERRERLEALAGWPDSDLFDAAERAALAWAEALTRCRSDQLDALHGDLRQHFDAAAAAAVTMAVATINAWNRIGIARHRAAAAAAPATAPAAATA